jgi:hypothetical protein
VATKKEIARVVLPIAKLEIVKLTQEQDDELQTAKELDRQHRAWSRDLTGFSRMARLMFLLAFALVVTT